MTFLGLIVKCRNGKFVKVEKEGVFELLNGAKVDGFAGREIHHVEKLPAPWEITGHYYVWDKKGKCPYHSDWDLMETRADQDPSKIEREWPNESK